MGLLAECPECKLRWSLKRDVCSCGFRIKKAPSKVYWVEYYDEHKRRRRERVGRSKQAAEQRLRNIETARAERRELRRSRNARVTLGELRDWYLALSTTRALLSFDDIEDYLNRVVGVLGAGRKISELSLSDVEDFHQFMLRSRNKHGRSYKPASINRHTSYLRRMLNLGVQHGRLDFNPIPHLQQLDERDNVRQVHLTQAEFEHLLSFCEGPFALLVEVAYYQAMRRGEILSLRWEWIDLESRFLKIPKTKNKERRAVPLHPRIHKLLLESAPEPLKGPVFSRTTFDRKQWDRVRQLAGFPEFNFHDLRHCAVNNLRLEGNDRYLIMQISGHKTESAFRRYNLVTEEEMKRTKWANAAEEGV
jgi:integrase